MIRYGSPVKHNEQSGTIHQRARKLCFDHYIALDQALTCHLEVAVPVLQNPDFNPELVSRYDGLTESAFIDSRKIDELGVSAMIATEQKDNPNLGECFNEKHSRHYGMIGEVALEEGLVNRNVFEPHHIHRAVSLEDSIYKQEWETLRQYLQDLEDL